MTDIVERLRREQAEQALREAGAIYGADAALAALRKEIKA